MVRFFSLIKKHINKILTIVHMFYVRTFVITISNKKAKEWGLVFHQNIHGDLIACYWECRSIWVDGKNRRYRVKNLHFDIIPTFDNENIKKDLHVGFKFFQK